MHHVLVKSDGSIKLITDEPLQEVASFTREEAGLIRDQLSDVLYKLDAKAAAERKSEEVAQEPKPFRRRPAEAACAVANGERAPHQRFIQGGTNQHFPKDRQMAAIVKWGRLRKSGMTLAQLAIAAGVSHSNARNFLRGQHSVTHDYGMATEKAIERLCQERGLPH